MSNVDLSKKWDDEDREELYELVRMLVPYREGEEMAAETLARLLRALELHRRAADAGRE